LITGSYSPESARRFAERAKASGVAAGHFRETAIGTVSSLGIGTYLGDPDDATDSMVEEAVVEARRLGCGQRDRHRDKLPFHAG
jgi:hypothetical protein